VWALTTCPASRHQLLPQPSLLPLMIQVLCLLDASFAFLAVKKLYPKIREFSQNLENSTRQEVVQFWTFPCSVYTSSFAQPFQFSQGAIS
jgi:hypothetical protein